MKYSEIYRKAAEVIDSKKEDFSCTAIRRAEGYSRTEETGASKAYCELYELGNGRISGEDGNAPNLNDLWSMPAGEDNEKKEQRVYMLLFAAAEQEAEGD